MHRPSRPCMHAIMTQHGLEHKGFHISLLSLMDMYKRKFCLHQEQPNFSYAEVNLNIACNQGKCALYMYTTISIPGTNQAWMGSHHHQVAILVQDDKLDCFELWKKFCSDKNDLSFYPGPILPSRTDGSPVSSLRVWKLLWAWLSKVNNCYYWVGRSRNEWFRQNLGLRWVN